MKKLFILSSCYLLNFYCYSQNKILPIIAISHKIAMIGSYKTDNTPAFIDFEFNQKQYYYSTSIITNSSNIKGGVALQKLKYSIILTCDYQFLFCRNPSFAYQKMYSNKYIMRSHFLGMNLIFRLREQKIIRPYIGVSLLTEINTNYKDRYLSSPNYYPVSLYLPNIEAFNADINFYKSTPFIGDIMVGCDFRLYKGLSINGSIGYEIRIIKSQYGILHYQANNPNPTVSIIDNPYKLGFNMLTIQFGLSYAFDIHKKQPKTFAP